MLNHMPVMDMLQDRFKAGYWFTITLFEYFVIVDLLRLLACKKQRLYDALLILASIVCYGLSMPTVQRMYADVTTAHILGLAQWKYFIFFTLGMFVRRASETIISDKGGAAIVSTFLIVFVANAIGNFQLNGLLYNLNLLLKEISIVLMAYYVFYTYRSKLSSHTKMGRWLSKIGTYTLEIYLMHYFVLPRHLNGVVDIVGLDENPLLASIVSIVIALMVVCVVLVFVAILQSNSYVKKILWNK